MICTPAEARGIRCCTNIDEPCISNMCMAWRDEINVKRTSPMDYFYKQEKGVTSCKDKFSSISPQSVEKKAGKGYCGLVYKS